MKRPNPIIYLFGNPVSVLVLAGAAIFFAYKWWIGDAGGMVALVAVALAGYATTASERIEKYRMWKLEWDAMSGKPPSGLGRALGRLPGLRFIVGGAAWCFLAFLAIGAAKQPGMEIPVALFWLATLVLVVAGIYRLMKRVLLSRKPFRDLPVTLCVPVPRQSPTPSQAMADLPAYCRPLFRRTSHETAPTTH